MHKDFFRKYIKHIAVDPDERDSFRMATAAPRGFAKSTVKNLVLPLHSIVYGYEKYIIMISATLKQARQKLKNIRNEILTNQTLREYYGISEPTPKERRSWTQQAININGVQVEAYSAGTEIRGISYGEFRPSRIILDDAEDSGLVESSEGRERLLEWFNEVIENLGDRFTVIEVVGTLLHPESLLSTLLKRPDFDGKIYRAVMSFADNGDLWEKWRLKYTNLSDENRLETARAFFRKNRNNMLRGSSVLWSVKEDYYELMTQMVNQGRRAFYQEKQNDPLSSENRIFNRDSFRYFTLEGNTIRKESPGGKSRTVSLKSLVICGFLDAAMGKGKTRRGGRRGDFASIVTVGMDSEGFVYVLDAWLKRVPPTKQIARIFDLHERFTYHRFGIEANCFQSLLLLPLEEERERRKNAGKAWDVPVSEVTQREKKETRIMTLEPLVSNGWLLFNRSLPEEFFRQMEDVPEGRHDDGPDALAGAADMAGKFLKNLPSQTPRKKEMRRAGKHLSWF